MSRVTRADGGMGVFCCFGYIRLGYIHSGRRGMDLGSRVIEVCSGMHSRHCLVVIGFGRSSCFVHSFCWKGRCFDLSVKGLETIVERWEPHR